MSLESTLEAAISAIVGAGRCWPDRAPRGTLPPYATYFQVGGQTVDPINGSDPRIRNARVQIDIWSKTRKQANDMMRALETSLRPNPISGRPIGALRARHEQLIDLFGAEQDFTIWYT